MAPIRIFPKPETVIRVLMKYRGLDDKIQVEPIEIKTPDRRGFVVVEWGGSLR